MLLGFQETLDQDAAIGLDDPLRGDIIGIGCEFDVSQPLGGGFRKQLCKRLRRMAAPLFPRYDGVADVAQAMRRECLSTRLPTKADGTAEFAVADPSRKTRKTWDSRAIRKTDRPTPSLPIDKTCQERVTVFCDHQELLVRRHLPPHVIR